LRLCRAASLRLGAFALNSSRLTASLASTSPTNELGTSHCSYAMEGSRHNAGANLTFADDHTAYFPYSYIAANVGTRPGDPGRPDINWTYNCVPVP